LTEVTRIWGIELDDDDEDALGCPAGLVVVLELELLERFNVPFTSTFFPIKLEKLDALPLNRYVVPLMAPVVPVGFAGLVAVGLFAALGDVDPPDVEASVRM
jgi:hypothetical protein